MKHVIEPEPTLWYLAFATEMSAEWIIIQWYEQFIKQNQPEQIASQLRLQNKNTGILIE